MCSKGWKDDIYNPFKLPIITIEYKHEGKKL